jgi:hypothetical protein
MSPDEQRDLIRKREKQEDLSRVLAAQVAEKQRTRDAEVAARRRESEAEAQRLRQVGEGTCVCVYAVCSPSAPSLRPC